jgi:hypothetical protein
MARKEVLAPAVIGALNAQRKGLGDELSKRLEDGVAQAVDDYLTAVVDEENRAGRMEGRILKEITKAAVLALVTMAPSRMLDAEARERAGAPSALGRGLR